MNTSDATLLGRFVRERNEAAFTELARRHSGLIYHTALRRTFNHAMAQEVSQQVLCSLARKAANLALTIGNDGLGPWLHRATVFEASKVLRSEASQQRRKQLQHPDSMPATGSETSPWEDALPHLDPALNKLGESDRRVLILRFFRRLSFQEIAVNTGRSAEAVQKQSSRALEKLSGVLRARGVVVPVAALAAGLTAESAKAAPVALLSSLSTHALATTVTLPSNPLLVMIATKTKVLVPIAVIVCAIPLILQQSALSSSERRLAALQQSVAATSDPADSPSARRRPARTETAYNGPVSDSRDLETLINEMGMLKTSADRAAFTSKLETMPTDERVRLIKMIAARTDIAPMTKAMYLSGISWALEDSDPGAFCVAAADAFSGNPAFDGLFNNAMGYSVFETWLKKDPSAVHAWVDSLLEQKKRGDWSPERLVATFQVPLFNQLFHENPTAAKAMLDKESAEGREYLMRCAITSYHYGGGKPNPEALLTYLQYARELPTRAGEPTGIDSLANSLAMGSQIGELQIWFERGNLNESEKQIIGVRLADASVHSAVGSAAKQALLRQVMPKDADRLIQEAQAKFGN